MSFSKNSKDANGTLVSCAKHGDKNKKKSGNQNVAKNIYTKSKWSLVALLKSTELENS